MHVRTNASTKRLAAQIHVAKPFRASLQTDERVRGKLELRSETEKNKNRTDIDLPDFGSSSSSNIENGEVNGYRKRFCCYFLDYLLLFHSSYSQASIIGKLFNFVLKTV